MSKTRLEKGASWRIEWLAGCRYHLVNNRRRCHPFRIAGLYLGGLQVRRRPVRTLLLTCRTSIATTTTALHLGLRHAHHLLCDVVCFLLVFISGLVNRRFRLEGSCLRRAYGNPGEIPFKVRRCGSDQQGVAFFSIGEKKPRCRMTPDRGLEMEDRIRVMSLPAEQLAARRRGCRPVRLCRFRFLCKCAHSLEAFSKIPSNEEEHATMLDEGQVGILSNRCCSYVIGLYHGGSTGA